MARQTPLLVAVMWVALGSACFLPPRGAAPVSSERSDYSPVVSFRPEVRVTDSVRVRIDRTRVLYPGEVFEGMGALTGRVEMQALLVTDNPAANLSAPASVDRNGTRKPWLELSVSQPVRIADSLHSGIAQNVGPLTFALALPSGVDVTRSWLVYRITGSAVSLPARMADGSVMDSGMQMPPIRVFACAITNLNGKRDKARAKVMADAYSAGC